MLSQNERIGWPTKSIYQAPFSASEILGVHVIANVYLKTVLFILSALLVKFYLHLGPLTLQLKSLQTKLIHQSDVQQIVKKFP